jgi:hypothetical protein
LALGLFATDRKRPACCCSLFNLMAFVDAINLYQDPCPDPCRLDEDRDKDRDKDSDASSRPPNGDIPVSHELENRAPSSCPLFVLRFLRRIGRRRRGTKTVHEDARRLIVFTTFITKPYYSRS